MIANLWEWNWVSVAKECTTVLGPKGYGGVQVAPPQDSLSKTDGPVHPWWEVYQPVDYNLTSRMGNEAQFKSMVATCRKAGVKVYVDAVINHMTGQGNISYGGVSYSKYDYQGLYTSANFHHTPADCPTASGNIEDFNNYLQVTKCELVSLSDLRTETSYVRNRLAAYLNKLIGYGVSGFRVDAAKHIPQADMQAIEKLLHRTVDGTRPYIALEVPPGGPGKLSPWAFQGTGDLLGFDFAQQIHDAFKSYTTPPGGNITDLQVFGEQSGLLPSDKSLAFVANHDTERNGSTLSYKDGATYILATEFMLARGYGTPAGVLQLRLHRQRRLAAGRRQRLHHQHRLRPRLGVRRPQQGRGEPGRLAQLRGRREGDELGRRRGQPDRLQPRAPGLDRAEQRRRRQDHDVPDRAAARHLLRRHPRQPVRRPLHRPNGQGGLARHGPGYGPRQGRGGLRRQGPAAQLVQTLIRH